MAVIKSAYCSSGGPDLSSQLTNSSSKRPDAFVIDTTLCINSLTQMQTLTYNFKVIKINLLKIFYNIKLFQLFN